MIRGYFILEHRIKVYLVNGVMVAVEENGGLIVISSADYWVKVDDEEVC